MQVIDLANRKAEEKELKYKNIQKIRRYFFVAPQKLENNHEGVQFVLKCLSERICKEDKYYALNQGFESFSNTYPFMLLDEVKLKEAA